MVDWNLYVFTWFIGSFWGHVYGVITSPDIKVRLVDGRSNLEGRVELYYNGTWGTVCDDKFGNLDAGVFCYMLGYERHGALAKSGGYFGSGKGQIWLDDLGCTGTETSVAQCNKRRGMWGSHNCGQDEDAGIVCQPKIRFVGNKTKYEGLLEINYSSKWGTVCPDHFKSADAQVFCHMLGYERNGAAMLPVNISRGHSDGPVLLGNANCHGNETSISECKKSDWAPKKCNSNTGAAIKCFPKYGVRLIGGMVEYEGRVEIYVDDWKTVCSDNFTDENAQVLCHMLGYPREGAIAYGKAYFGQGTGNIWNGNLGCIGDEQSIAACKNKLSDSNNCGHIIDTGIRCKPNVRLVGGRSEYEGRVEVYHSGIWGTVCNDGVDWHAAEVFCYMFGYHREGSNILNRKYTKPGKGVVWLDDLGCYGQETSVDECSKKEDTWGNHNCDHTEDVGVTCTPKSTCTALALPNHGEYSNISCTSTSSPVGTHCKLLCKDGFRPLAENMTTCFGTGLWNTSDIFMTCLDIDECKEGTHLCSQNCRNTIGEYECYCDDGYALGNDNTSCNDINECNTDNGGCSHNCTNEIASFFCTCLDGYFLDADRLACPDVNECNTSNGGCNQICINEEGSYQCDCNSGYIMTSDNLTCTDHDECSDNNGGCGQVCVNTEGNFLCSCYDGYLMNNETNLCEDINECEVENGKCGHNCHNSNGSFSCSCLQGYKLHDDNKTCLDINECINENGGCDQNCTNENGTFKCSCYEGYLLQNDSMSCVDINECNIENGGCEHVCSNTNGSYECSCTHGYTLQNDSFSCNDTNECELKNGGCEQICVNYVGNFSCQCGNGFLLHDDTFSCIDVNECNDSRNGNCEQICNNYPGSYSCSCREGFSLDGTNVSCADIKECDIDNGGCQQLCRNLVGSFTCGCEYGYALNGNEMTCEDVSGRSQSSSLRILLNEGTVNDLNDSITYKSVRQQFGISLQRYFKNYTNSSFSITIQHLLKMDGYSNVSMDDIVIVDFTVVYAADTNSAERDNIDRGILSFNDTKLLQYGGKLVAATLINEPPTVSPPSVLVSLRENTPVGAKLGVFTVQDFEDDIRGDIRVYSNDKPDEIGIERVSDGKVELVLIKQLDVDKYPRTKGSPEAIGHMVNFTIVVEDRPGLQATAHFSLIINDINDNAPVCRPALVTVKIPRDEDNGTEVKNLNTICRDNDYFFNRITFDIENDMCNAFSVNSSGLLILESTIMESHPFCTIGIQVTDRNNSQFYTKLTVVIKFHECPPDIDFRNNAWRRGSPGKYTSSKCPEGYKGKVRRFCNLEAEYQDPIYNCTSAAIAEIMEKVLQENTSVSSVLTDLANVTAPSNNTNTSLMVGDLEAVNKVMSKITEVIEVNTENVDDVADFFVETANNILDETTTTSWTSVRNESGSGADNVLENLDRFAEKISNVSVSKGEIKIAKSNLFLKVGSTNACNGNDLQFPNRSSGDVPTWAERTMDKIQISCSDELAPKSFSSVMYRNLSKILPSTVVGNSSKRSEEKLNAPVMSFSYFPNYEGNLEKPIEITFQLYNGFLERPLCSFWKKSNDEGSEGGWSTEGCWLERFDKQTKTVTCKCNHLTNFAVLMSPSSAEVDHHALSVISLVGCSLSMLCLFITVAIHGYFWRTLKSDKTILSLNLACALFVAYVIFIAGVNQTENKGACTAVAVLLHLVYLVVFFIMLSEGLMLAKTVIFPLNTRKPLTPLLIASYGLPVIIVAISMGSHALEGYGDDKSCWLSTKSDLIWAFLVPALTISLINMAIVIMVLRSMFKTSFLSKKSKKEKAVTGARSIAVMMPIMGITWVLGVFSVNEDTVVFQYLFAIFNSTQGVLIFVFHCLLDKKVQKAFTKQKSKWRSLRSYASEKSTSSNMKSTRVTDNTSSVM